MMNLIKPFARTYTISPDEWVIWYGDWSRSTEAAPSMERLTADIESLGTRTAKLREVGENRMIGVKPDESMEVGTLTDVASRYGGSAIVFDTSFLPDSLISMLDSVQSVTDAAAGSGKSAVELTTDLLEGTAAAAKTASWFSRNLWMLAAFAGVGAVGYLAWRLKGKKRK